MCFRVLTVTSFFSPKDLTICLCKDLDLINSTWQTVPWTCLQVAMGPWEVIITQCHLHRACQYRIRWLWAKDSLWATMAQDQIWTCNPTKVNATEWSTPLLTGVSCKTEGSRINLKRYFWQILFPSLNLIYLYASKDLVLFSPVFSWLHSLFVSTEPYSNAMWTSETNCFFQIWIGTSLLFTLWERKYFLFFFGH